MVHTAPVVTRNNTIVLPATPCPPPARIGIIAAGMLRCLGSGLRLKSRFGDGIRVSVAFATHLVWACC